MRWYFNQGYSLSCRDYPRSQPVTAASYQVIKGRLISSFPRDGERYYDIKDPLCNVIMDGAEAWATLSGGAHQRQMHKCKAR